MKFLLCAALCALALGCVQPIDQKQSDGSTPAPSVTLKTSDVAEALARRIRSGTFRHSDELLQTVNGLAEAKEITSETAARLIEACPGIRDKRRELTASDADAVSAVK